MEPQARCRNNSSPRSCGRVRTLVWRKRDRERDAEERMRKGRNIVADKSIITSLTAKIHVSYFPNSSYFGGPLPPFLQPCWMIINTALLYWIRSWQLWTLQNNRQLPRSVLLHLIRSVCVTRRLIEKKAKEKAERVGFWSMAPSSGPTISHYPPHRENNHTWSSALLFFPH